jgi:hypothetical protein
MSQSAKYSKVYIWSDQWKALWRPKAQGYTDKIEEAGFWDWKEAWELTKHSGTEKGIKICRFVKGKQIDLEKLDAPEIAFALPPDGWLVYDKRSLRA